jgi:serine/threonine protein phosphatase 1
MKMNSRFVAIGDVHGDVRRLEQALQWAKNRDRLVILLGDYVNRGYDSKNTIELLINACGEHQIIALKGNHEVSLLDFLDTGTMGSFAAMGGLATMKSYLDDLSGDVIKDFITQFPVSHRQFLNEMHSYYEIDGALLTHSGLNPAQPKSRADPDVCGNGYPGLFKAVWSESFPDKLICGHYVQRTRLPYISDRLVCIDTGCGTLPQGPLTAYLSPENEYKQF